MSVSMGLGGCPEYRVLEFVYYCDIIQNKYIEIYMEICVQSYVVAAAMAVALVTLLLLSQKIRVSWKNRYTVSSRSYTQRL